MMKKKLNSIPTSNPTNVQPLQPAPTPAPAPIPAPVVQPQPVVQAPVQAPAPVPTPAPPPIVVNVQPQAPTPVAAPAPQQPSAELVVLQQTTQAALQSLQLQQQIFLESKRQDEERRAEEAQQLSEDRKRAEERVAEAERLHRETQTMLSNFISIYPTLTSAFFQTPQGSDILKNALSLQQPMQLPPYVQPTNHNLRESSFMRFMPNLPRPHVDIPDGSDGDEKRAAEFDQIRDQLNQSVETTRRLSERMRAVAASETEKQVQIEVRAEPQRSLTPAFLTTTPAPGSPGATTPEEWTNISVPNTPGAPRKPSPGKERKEN